VKSRDAKYRGRGMKSRMCDDVERENGWEGARARAIGG